MGNNHSYFSGYIASRNYAKGIKFAHQSPCKGDIVLFDHKPCLVVRANGVQSLSVIELLMRNGEYDCPYNQPIYDGKQKVLISRPGGYDVDEELLIWHHPYDYILEPILQCSLKMNWSQYKSWFHANWPVVQCSLNLLANQIIYDTSTESENTEN